METLQASENCRCNHCLDVFPTEKAIRLHLFHKHKQNPRDWIPTQEPVTRPTPDWQAKIAARKLNKRCVGPFKCLLCGFKAKTIRGIAVHIGSQHKEERPSKQPILVDRDFEALGTGKRGPYKPRTMDKTSSRIAQAVLGGKPQIDIDFPLTDEITIRVPLVLGPPVFIERNGDGS